jgi:hypothetical protein
MSGAIPPPQYALIVWCSIKAQALLRRKIFVRLKDQTIVSPLVSGVDSLSLNVDTFNAFHFI